MSEISARNYQIKEFLIYRSVTNFIQKIKFLIKFSNLLNNFQFKK